MWNLLVPWTLPECCWEGKFFNPASGQGADNIMMTKLATALGIAVSAFWGSVVGEQSMPLQVPRKTDLPYISAAQLPSGDRADPYPASYSAVIPLAPDDEFCDDAIETPEDLEGSDRVVETVALAGFQGGLSAKSWLDPLARTMSAQR
jgi:hypothetical protein